MSIFFSSCKNKIKELQVQQEIVQEFPFWNVQSSFLQELNRIVFSDNIRSI